MTDTAITNKTLLKMRADYVFFREKTIQFEILFTYSYIEIKLILCIEPVDYSILFSS